MTLLIGVAGISGSGKSSICRDVAKRYKEVMVVSQDSFYKGLPDGVVCEDYNFDSIDALDVTAIREFFIACKKTKTNKIQIPQYDFVQHSRSGYKEITLSDVVMCEGHLIFTLPELRSLVDKIIFIDVAMDIALIRRIRRDIESRGRSISEILDMYEQFVRGAALKSINLKEICDLILTNEHYPRTLDNASAWFSQVTGLEEICLAGASKSPRK